MKNTLKRRPCSEIILEISHIRKNIDHINRDISNGKYSAEDLEGLRRNLEWQNERLAEAQEKLNDCE